MVSSGEHSARGASRNPCDLTRSPGGSSSGSAAAVAAGLVPIALGSDTGGSVRQPAAFCGVVGFKPSYGRISRSGLVAFGSSLDQIGPLTRSTRDAALLLSLLAGPDPDDATCLDLPAPPAEPPADIAGARVGVPREWLEASADAALRAHVEQALATFESLGAELCPLSLPSTPHAVAAYYVVAAAEASSNLARYDGVRYGERAAGTNSLQEMFARTREAGFGAEVKRRILLGTYVLSAGYHEAWYVRALKVRGRIVQELEQAFEEVDLLAGPTTPTLAFELGEHGTDPLAMYGADALTVPASLAGLPAISLPCGALEHAGARLPVGLQLVGPRLADERVLAAAQAFEQARAEQGETPPEPGGGA